MSENDETVERVALLPCPFCGGEATGRFPVYLISADCADARICCTNCDAEGPSFLCDMGDADAKFHWPAARAEAIAAWNARAAIAAMPERGGWQEEREMREMREVLEGIDSALDASYRIGGDLGQEDEARLLVSAFRARARALLTSLPTPPESAS